MTPSRAPVRIYSPPNHHPNKDHKRTAEVSVHVWGASGASSTRFSGAQGRDIGWHCLLPWLPHPCLRSPSQACRPRARSGAEVQRSRRRGAAARALFREDQELTRKTCRRSGAGPGPVQSRPFPARCFRRPGGQSSALGRRGEAQACLFLCLASPESRSHGRWPSSRSFPRWGGGSRGPLAGRGFSGFHGLSSVRGLSLRGLSFRGLSFCGLPWGPSWARGARSPPAASSGSPASFPAASALLGAFVSSAGTGGAAGPGGGVQASGFSCNQCGMMESAQPRPLPLPPHSSSQAQPLPSEEGSAPAVAEGNSYRGRRWLFWRRAWRDPWRRGRDRGVRPSNHHVWGWGV